MFFPPPPEFKFLRPESFFPSAIIFATSYWLDLTKAHIAELQLADLHSAVSQEARSTKAPGEFLKVQLGYNKPYVIKKLVFDTLEEC